MALWTTATVQTAFLPQGLLVELRPEEDLKSSFLADAKSCDLVILPLDNTYLEFHDAVKARNPAGRIVFLSSGQEPLQPMRPLTNALILDARKFNVRDITQFLSFLSRPMDAGLSPDARLTQSTGETSATCSLAALDDPKKINTLLSDIIKNKRPVIMECEIRERGEPVMARSTCTIKETKEGKLLLHNFKHSFFLKSLKKDMFFKVFFPSRPEDKEAIVTIREIQGTEISISLPEKLFPVKDIRIQPSREKPPGLFVLIPDEPSKNYRILDISTKGLGFLCDRDLPVGSRYSLTIILPDPQAVVVSEGWIRFKKESGCGYQYGAEITPHLWDAELIAQYMMKREQEIIGLLRGN
jgi:hypothetical protein